MNTYLVTGAMGFIGSHLVEHLKKKNRVIGIDNGFHACRDEKWKKENSIIWADVRDNISQYVKDCDAVFHLAAQIHVDRSIQDPRQTLDINVQGTLNILEAVTRYGKEMVFASTSEVYGSSQNTLMTENHPLDGQSPYAASKIAGDRLCKAYYDTYGTRVSILRNFNTFGPYQADDSYGGVIAIFVRKALLGETLRIFGTGEQQRDYMWVSDAIQGYELCLKSQRWGKALNIGSGKTISINELANLIIEITGSKSKIKYDAPRPGEVMRLCANTWQAEQLGYKPTTNFRNNLNEYVEFYRGSILPTLR